MTHKAEEIVPMLKTAGTNPIALERAMPAVLEGMNDLVMRLKAAETASTGAQQRLAALESKLAMPGAAPPVADAQQAPAKLPADQA